MTSGISYLKLSKEYRRHHVAEFLVIIFFVFLHVLGFVINLQNTLSQHQGKEAEMGERLRQVILNSMTPNVFVTFFVGMLGALIAITAFSYLHSKTKMDFYHSLPVKRIDIYKLIVGNVTVMFLVPAAIGLALECLICGFAGYLTVACIVQALKTLAICLLCFMVCFLTEGLAMILTGNLICGILGGLVFALYSPVLLFGVVNGYCSTFFKTFVASGDNMTYSLFSPMSLSIFMCQNEAANWQPNPLFLKMSIFWIIVLLVLDGWLFTIRASEKAGKSIAFSKIMVPLRFIMVVPMSLLCGWALYQITLSQSKVWLLVGIIISAVLLHGLVEALYQMDIRGLWSHKIQMLITMALAVAIAGAFFIDLFGYDRWLPSRDQLEAVEIKDTRLQDNNVAELECMSSQWEGIKGKDLDRTYAFLKKVVEREDYRASEDEDNGDEYYDLQVTYRLNNGKEKLRYYKLPVKAYVEDLDALYVMEEYKKENSLLYNLDQLKVEAINFSMARVDYPFGNANIEIKASDREKFIELLKEDYRKLSYSDFYKTIPSGMVEITWRIKKAENSLWDPYMANYSSYSYYYIYPSFSKTLSWLKEKGYMDESEKESWDIKSLGINVYKMNPDTGETLEDISFQIKNPAVIKEVQPKLIPSDLADIVPGEKALGIDTDMTIEASFVRAGEEASVNMRTDRETAEKLMGLK